MIVLAHGQIESINTFIASTLLRLSFVYIHVLLCLENRFFFHLMMMILFLRLILIMNLNMIKCETIFCFYILDHLIQNLSILCVLLILFLFYSSYSLYYFDIF